MSSLLQDLRYGLRVLARSPLFSAVAIVSLALGIGANSAIYTLVDTVLFRPWPVERAEDLVMAYRTATGNSAPEGFSYPDYEDYRGLDEVFAGLAAYSPTPLSVSSGVTAESVSGDLVSANYFSTLGIRAVAGRLFAPDEEDKQVAVLSHALWRRLFNQESEIIGRAISLNGKSFTVIGVAPLDFRGVSLGAPAEVWIPLRVQPVVATGFMAMLPILSLREVSWLEVVGRLRGGVTAEQAEAAMNVVAQQIGQGHPGTRRAVVQLASARSASLGLETREDLLAFLRLLGVIVVLELVIACANVGGLLLVRATGRQREAAVRLALGADRRRLGRQLLTESVLLAIVGGVASLLVAVWAMGLLSAFELPGAISIGVLALRPDIRLLGFALLLSLLSGIAFGLPMAWHITTTRLASALRERAGGGGAKSTLLRNTLVVVQVALCFLLLAGAGLFIRSLREVLTADLGFDADPVLCASLSPALQGYDEPHARRFYSALSGQVSTLPGVQAASWAKTVGLSPTGIRMTVYPEGYQPRPNEDMQLDLNVVAPGYFRTLGLPLLQGRDFNELDAADHTGVVIVNESMAGRFWPGESPIGKRISTSGPKGPFLEVVGLARDAKYKSLKEAPLAYMYLPLRQQFGLVGLSEMTLLVRAASDPEAIAGPLRKEVQRLDPELPVAISTLRDELNQVLMPQRMGATLLTFFGLLALVLVVAGIYGVVAYFVEQRRHEIGVRMALGARRKDVLGLVLKQSLVLVGIGLAVGLATAYATGRVLSRFLYEVDATDLLTLSATCVLLAAVACFAGGIPAFRATKISPTDALRYE